MASRHDTDGMRKARRGRARLSLPRRARKLVMKYRASLQDLGLLAAMVAATGFLLFALDVFISAHHHEASAETQHIDLDKTLVLGTLTVLGLLVFAARRYFAQQKELRRRVLAEQHARELAYQDPLTGLPNRRQFEEALSKAAVAPPRSGAVHAILMLDLNGFKRINDTYGHDAGDEVLVVVAQRLAGVLRENALVARLGGDEFVMLLTHMAGVEAVTSIAMRVVRALSEPISTGTGEHEIGAGIGIALLPDDARNASEAMRKADVALYRAKAERRSAFRYFEEDMDRLVRERDTMEHELREAIANDQIRPRFRPTMDLRSRKVIGFEVVPSWFSEELGEVPPERFLPIAEETGLIHALGESLLERACEVAKGWPNHVTLSIDILPGQLTNTELWLTILGILSKTGLPPGRLEVEITESMIVKDIEAAKAALGPLGAAGVRIALDNFGTGYSNLYHMKELKIDRVKIDRRLIENMTGTESVRMVRALAGLGHGLGVAVSAEGVGDPGRVALLLNSGVHEGQSIDSQVTAEQTLSFFTDEALGRTEERRKQVDPPVLDDEEMPPLPFLINANL